MTDAHETAPNPKALARTRDAKLEQLGARANLLRGSIIGGWMLIAVVMGLMMSAGSLVHAGWLAAMTVATLLSPIAYILLRDVNRKHEAARLALVADEHSNAALAERSTTDHLRGALAEFHAETRLIRHSLSDAVAPGEGVRMLWEWRRNFDALMARETEREQLEELGVGLGPIASLLAGLERNATLSTEQRHEAAIHLEHIERLLGQIRAGGYR